MKPLELLDRCADDMTGPEWAWCGYAILTTAVGAVAVPVLALTIITDHQGAFWGTAGAAAGGVLICLLQAVYFAVKNRD